MKLQKTLTRTITFDILEGAQVFPVVGLLGSRQSGKTLLSQLIFKEHAYVSLDDIEHRTAATFDPRTFLNEHCNESGIIIDEFHYVPELLTAIQDMITRNKKAGTFILVGSQNAFAQEMLGQIFTETSSIHTLLPLSLRELTQNYLLPKNVDTVLYKGLLPAVYAENSDKNIYKKIISRYLEKDIWLSGQVENITTFHRFLTHCAAWAGQSINITALANECSISDHTARRWISLLEGHHTIFLLPSYHTTFGKRVIKSPKLYFYDPGIICSLLNIREDELQEHPQRNALFECLIVSELIKWHTNRSKEAHLYFWRDKTDHEIDCIIEEGNHLIPINIQTQAKKNTDFLKSLHYWHRLTEKKQKGFSIYQELEQLTKNDINLISWYFMQPLYSTLIELS